MTELYEGRESEKAAVTPPNLTPWITVAVLAILAGIGTATLPRPAGAEPESAAREGAARVRGMAPRMVEITFHPRTTRGSKIAKVAFRFTYECRARDRESVRQRLEEMPIWGAMRARILKTLMQRTIHELRGDSGLEAVETAVRSAIDGVLFVDGIAHTSEIQWEQILVQ